MKGLASFCDRVLSVAIPALVLFTPLAFGSVETWAIVGLETAIFALALVWLAGRILEGRGRRSTGLEVPILLFLGVAVFQLIPLPRGLLSIVSPRVEELYQRTVPGFSLGSADRFEDWLLVSDAGRMESAAAPEGAHVRRPITYSVPNTVDQILLFSAYALAFLIVADRYRDPGRLRRLLIWIVFVGVGIAILGIFQKLAWNGKVLWLRSAGPGTRPFGPFVNPNHFAGYMELIVPLAVGLLLTLLSRQAQFGYRLERTRPREVEGSEPKRLVGSVLQQEDSEVGLPWTATSTVPKAVMLGFLVALSIGSIVLSLSRGGFMATLLTFALFARLLVPPVLRGRARQKTLAAVVTILVLALGISYWIGASALAERFATLSDAQTEPSFLGRADTWRRTIGLFRDHATLGCGLGTFQIAFSGYYPPGTIALWAQAHNDYLQLLAEVGVAGMIPALFALVVFARRRFIPALRDRRRPDRYLSLGLAMAIVSILLHSLVDFNLQIPAVGFLFVVIGGLLVAAGPPETGSRERPQRAGAWRRLRALGAIVLLALTSASAVAGWRRIAAERLTSRASGGKEADRAHSLLEQAMGRTPRQPGPVSAYGDRLIWTFDHAFRAVRPRLGEGEILLEKAERAYRSLIDLIPCSAWGWWGLGQVYERRGEIERLESEIDIGRIMLTGETELGPRPRLSLAALRTAIFLEPNGYQIQDEIGDLYLGAGMRTAALEVYKESTRKLPIYNQHTFGPPAALPDDMYRAIIEGMDGALRDPGVMEPARIQREIGQMAYLRRDLPEAERRYRLALMGATSKLIADTNAYLLGEVLRQEGKSEEATPLLERASGSPGVGWRAWVSLGHLRAAASDHKGALLAYRSAASLAPAQAEPPLFVARETARSGDRDRAIGQLRYLIGSSPPALQARETLIQLLREEGKPKEALAEARALVALAGARPDYLRLVADLGREVERIGR